MWDLPGPGLELMSPALAGGFLTTAPPGKPWENEFELIFFNYDGKPLKGFNQRHEIILCMLLHKIALALVWTNTKTLAVV